MLFEENTPVIFLSNALVMSLGDGMLLWIAVPSAPHDIMDRDVLGASLMLLWANFNCDIVMSTVPLLDVLSDVIAQCLCNVIEIPF